MVTVSYTHLQEVDKLVDKDPRDAAERRLCGDAHGVEPLPPGLRLGAVDLRPGLDLRLPEGQRGLYLLEQRFRGLDRLGLLGGAARVQVERAAQRVEHEAQRAAVLLFGEGVVAQVEELLSLIHI